MVSSFSEWSSRRASLTNTNAPPYPTRSLWISALSEFYGPIVTRYFDPLQPINLFFTNFNLTLSQSGSYITRMLTYYISAWSVKGTPLIRLRRKVFPDFIFKYILDQTPPRQMELSRDVIWIMWEVSCRRHPADTLLADICEPKISTENSAKGIVSYAYALCVIISSAGFPKLSWGHTQLASE